jgi:hypothetical protein
MSKTTDATSGTGTDYLSGQKFKMDLIEVGVA